MTDDQNQYYPIPFMIRSGYKCGMHLCFIFLIAICTAPLSLLFLTSDIPFIIIAMFTVIDLFLFYCWFYNGVLKKAYVLLNDEGITVKLIFGKKSIRWTDIAGVQTYYYNHNSFIGILSKQKLRKRKDTFLSFLSALFGGLYSLSIPLKSFPKADPEKLYATIGFMVQNNQAENPDQAEWLSKDVPVNTDEASVITKERSTAGALLRVFLISLIVGILYGVSIYLLKINFLLIPFVSMFGMIYVYFKHYEKSTAHFMARFLFGIFCSMQFLIAVLAALILGNHQYIPSHGLMKTVFDCVGYMTDNPGDFIRYYACALIFFIWGISCGGSSPKFMRRIKKHFIKTQNGYSIEKNQRYISIYLINYTDFDENEEKTTVVIEPNQCLIEKDRKRICTLYMPVEILKQNNIFIKDMDVGNIHDKTYYQLCLGGHTAPREYGYSCNLVINSEHQLEIITIESD